MFPEKELMIEELAMAISSVIAERHGHAADDWMNEQRREEADGCF